MAMQTRVDNTNMPFVLNGLSFVQDSCTIFQDAGRATALAPYTVMAKIAATGKWVPLTDVAAVDGSNVARGIFMGDSVTAAAIAAGDVLNQPILIGGCCVVDTQRVVLENSLTLASVCSDDPAGADNGPVHVRTVADDLQRVGIFAESTIDITALET